MRLTFIKIHLNLPQKMDLTATEQIFYGEFYMQEAMWYAHTTYESLGCTCFLGTFYLLKYCCKMISLTSIQVKAAYQYPLTALVHEWSSKRTKWNAGGTAPERKLVSQFGCLNHIYPFPFIYIFKNAPAKFNKTIPNKTETFFLHRRKQPKSCPFFHPDLNSLVLGNVLRSECDSSWPWT